MLTHQYFYLHKALRTYKHTVLSEHAYVIYDLYVDLFLLWLLHRFMKPQKVLSDGRTEASAILFAHDAKAA